MVVIGTSGAIPEMAYTFIPIGGVINPISTILTVIMPNHIHGIVLIKNDNNPVFTTTQTSKHNQNNNPVGTTLGLSPEISNNNKINYIKNDFKRTTRGLSLQESDTVEINPIYKRQKNLLSKTICAFKTTSSKLIHRAGFPEFKWQRSFYDHIIRNEKALQKIREYILINPLKWEYDSENVKKI